MAKPCFEAKIIFWYIKKIEQQVVNLVLLMKRCFRECAFMYIVHSMNPSLCMPGRQGMQKRSFSMMKKGIAAKALRPSIWTIYPYDHDNCMTSYQLTERLVTWSINCRRAFCSFPPEYSNSCKNNYKCRCCLQAWDIIYTQRAPIAQKKLMDVSLQALAVHEQGPHIYICMLTNLCGVSDIARSQRYWHTRAKLSDLNNTAES